MNYGTDEQEAFDFTKRLYPSWRGTQELFAVAWHSLKHYGLRPFKNALHYHRKADLDSLAPKWKAVQAILYQKHRKRSAVDPVAGLLTWVRGMFPDQSRDLADEELYKLYLAGTHQAICWELKHDSDDDTPDESDGWIRIDGQVRRGTTMQLKRDPDGRLQRMYRMAWWRSASSLAREQRSYGAPVPEWLDRMCERPVDADLAEATDPETAKAMEAF